MSDVETKMSRRKQDLPSIAKNVNVDDYQFESTEELNTRRMPMRGFPPESSGYSNQAPPPPANHSSTTPGSVLNENASAQLLQTVNNLLEQNQQLMQMLQLERLDRNGRQNVEPPRPAENHYNMMPDFSKIIETFDGNQGQASARQWLKHLETSKVLHQWPDPFAYQVAISKLTGSARFWLQGHSTQIQDWDSFHRAFSRTFLASTTSKTELWRRMQARVQSARESTGSYFHEKVALCQDLNFSFAEIKEQVLIGLWSKELSNFLAVKEHIDSDSLYQGILEFERIDSARRSRINTQKPSLDVAASTKIEPKKEQSRESHHQTTLKIRCYNCNESGHMSNKCPKPQRLNGTCYGCGSNEHQKKNCPLNSVPFTNVPERDKDTEKKTMLVEKSKLSAAYFVPVTLQVGDGNINSTVTFDACLDTGSPISIIRSNMLPPGCYSAISNPDEFRGINGAHLEIIGKYDGPVIINKINVPISFYVVHEKTMQTAALLGRDFTDLPNLVIQISDRLVITEKIENQPEINTNQPNLTNSEINLIETHNDSLDLDINPNLKLVVQSDICDIVNEYLCSLKPETQSRF